MYEEDSYSSAIQYAADVLLGGFTDSPTIRPYLNEEINSENYGGIIFYGASDIQTSAPVIQIVPDSRLFGPLYGTEASLPVEPLPQENDLPVLYGTTDVLRSENRIRCYCDFISATYFMVTRYEEMVRHTVRDEHGRFPGRDSLPGRAGFIDTPIVDEYAKLISIWFRNLGVDVKPPERKFSLTLTHDVDTIHYFEQWNSPLTEMLRFFYGTKSFKHFMRAFGYLIGIAKDPHDNFDTLLKLDLATNQKIIYFFISRAHGQFGSDYDIRSSSVRKLISKIAQRGGTIGLHASYEAGEDVDLIIEEKKILESVIGGSIKDLRYHFLRWNKVEDGMSLSKIGIENDYSMGYPDLCGFRLGVSRPILLFDPMNLCLMGMTEHPLIVMDVSLLRPNYMNLNKSEALSYCEALFRKTKEHQGEFVILWHNNSFYQNSIYSELYTELLDMFSSEA